MPRKVDRAEVQRLQGEGAQIVDVLPREEHDEAHLPGSISLPLKEMTRERIDEVLRRDKTVVVYCWDFQ
jgi:rhodanese-related sulfurtransferase